MQSIQAKVKIKTAKHTASLRAYDSLTNTAKAKLQRELRELTLLTADKANAKTAKNQGRGYLSFILHLAPADVSGYNVCPAASLGCKAACLNTAGRGRFAPIQAARIRKTLYYIKLQNQFLEHLWSELTRLQAKAKRLGLTPVVRLNGTSDIAWELRTRGGLNAFQAFPGIQFYDYTKLIHRLPMLKLASYANYNLTFSQSEDNDANCMRALQLGFNVATVFAGMPEKYLGYPVIDGDTHDLRFLDGQGVIIGLKAKGKAKLDTTGFVKRACAA